MDRELLLEIGCEELPAGWLPGLRTQLGELFCAHPRAHRLPQHRRASLSRLRAAMRKAQKVERLRFPVAPRSSGLVGVATELDEARLVGMQRQPEPREALAQVGEEAVGFRAMLESDDEIIGEAHHDHVAVRLPRSPSLDPAASHFWMSRTTRRSATRCSMNRISQPWSNVSKKPRMSASSTQFTGLVSMATESASNA